MGLVREWVTDARCVECRGIYKIDYRKPLSQKCKPCSKAYKKTIKRTNQVRFISFLIFPLGFLMYFLWKDKKPDLAKTSLRAALIPFLFFILFYITIINLNIIHND